LLIHLIVDLSRNPELVTRFAKHPAEVLAEYGIAEETREILLKGDEERFNTLLARETQELVYELVSPTMLFPYPSLKAAPAPLQIKPTSGPIGSDIGVTVTGKNFAAEANLIFTRPDVAPVKGTSVQVTAGGTKMTAKAKFLVKGIYNVTVINPSTSGENGGLGTLPAAFTAVPM
jgi:hypothetical protein